MRIINQDGTMDIPYADFVFAISKDNKIICSKDCVGSPEILYKSIVAEYLTREKALKAMEMLRTEYGKHYLGQGGAMATANFYVPAFGFIPPKVFQFPKDDEIEV